jgi:tyrosyl-tRNA synthetase
MIGDPSDRSDTRPQLTREQIEHNITNYKEQLFKIVDPERTEFCYNSEWLGQLTPEQTMRLTATQTVAQLLARDDFSKRYQAQQPIGLHEFLYPIFQGYDSIAIRADVEIGGTDQTFNFLVAREMQRAGPLGEPQEPQCIVIFPLLVGTDGVEKMGKSLNNYIGIMEPPDQIFGKVMSVPDGAIVSYFELCTDVPADEVVQMAAEMQSGALNPRDAKRRLGREIVTLYHSADAAQRADETFLSVFSASRQQTREDYEAVAEEMSIPESLRGRPVWVATALADLGLTASKGEARRLIKGGGVYIDERRLSDPQEEVELKPGMLVRVGKRKVVKLSS